MLRSLRFYRSLSAVLLLPGFLGAAGCSMLRTAREEPAAAPAGATARKTVSASDEVKTPEAEAMTHFSLAQAYSTDGNADRAIEEYKLTLVYDPKSALVHARLATEYVRKGSLSEAIESCKAALQIDAKFIDARLMLAGLYATSHDSAAALKEYDRVLKQDPTQDEAAVYRAQLWVEEGKPDRAIQSLKAFVKSNPDSTLAWYYLGRTAQRLRQVDQAVAAYRKALEIKPSFAQAALALGFLFEEGGQNEKAIEVYKGIFDSAQDMGAAQRVATIYLKQEKFREAVPYLEALEASDSEDLNVRVKLGLVHMELKNYPRAMKLFQELLVRSPESDRIRYYLGNLHEEMKDETKAIEELARVKPESRLFSDARLHAAYLLKKAGRNEDAIRFVEESIQLSPKTNGFYIFAANLYEEQKNFAAAIAALEKARTYFDQDERISYYLGNLYDRTGQVDKSLAEMERLLSVNPENVDALNYIGYTWTVRGMRLNEAGALLKKAITLRPDNAFIRDSWGWYLYVRGRVGEAVIELEKAARTKPEEPTILEHLAEAYIKSNLPEKAYRSLVEAAKHQSDADSKQKLEEKITSLRSTMAGMQQVGGPELNSGRAPAQDTAERD